MSCKAEFRTLILPKQELDVFNYWLRHIHIAVVEPKVNLAFATVRIRLFHNFKILDPIFNILSPSEGNNYRIRCGRVSYKALDVESCVVDRFDVLQTVSVARLSTSPRVDFVASTVSYFGVIPHFQGARLRIG